MKLPDFTKSVPLNNLKVRMGIGADEFGSFASPLNQLTTEEQVLLDTGEGIEVAFDKLRVLDDQTLAYKGNRVLLYIRDLNYKSHGDADGRYPRYHVASCATLQDMHASGRFDRYVIATHTSGEFLLNILWDRDARAEWRKLNVCQRCLEKVKFPGFDTRGSSRARRLFVESFTPTKFFDRHPRSLHGKQPRHTYIDAPLNVYTQDFPAVTRITRQAANWQCSGCGLKITKKEHQRFLQTHHKNGQRWDNGSDNLEVVCIECHARKPHHSHIKNDPKYREFLKLKLFGKL